MNKLKKTIANIGSLDTLAMQKAQARLDSLTKPQGSLGRLERIAMQVAGITGEGIPSLKNKVIFTLAADHGVSEEGVSAFPSEVTLQMVYNFLNGGAAINVLARHVGARVIVVDMGVKSNVTMPQCHNVASFRDKKINYGTKNMAKGPAMTREEAIRSIEAGIEVFEEEYLKGIDIVGTGEMGIGNTCVSSAITAVITGAPVTGVTGRGTGIDEKALTHKIAVIKKAIAVNKPDAQDAIDCLSKIGGFEIGGLAGIILAAASKKVPIVIDGFISGAAALIAYKLEPKLKDYMIAGHCSVEKGHKVILDYIGLDPILNMDLRLGEGTGAALGIGIAEAAIKILGEMATFEDASVAEKIYGDKR